MGLDFQVNLWNVGTEVQQALHWGTLCEGHSLPELSLQPVEGAIVPCVDLELPRLWLLTPMLL